MIGFDREDLTDQILQDGSRARLRLRPAGDRAGPRRPDLPGGQRRPRAQGRRVRRGRCGRRASRRLARTPKLTMLFSDDSLAARHGDLHAGPVQEEPRGRPRRRGRDLRRRAGRVDAEDYEINYAFGWIGDYDDPMTFMDLYLSDSPFNNSFFENEEYDRLIKEAQTDIRPAVAHAEHAGGGEDPDRAGRDGPRVLSRWSPA